MHRNAVDTRVAKSRFVTILPAPLEIEHFTISIFDQVSNHLYHQGRAGGHLAILRVVASLLKSKGSMSQLSPSEGARNILNAENVAPQGSAPG